VGADGRVLGVLAGGLQARGLWLEVYMKAEARDDAVPGLLSLQLYTFVGTPAHRRPTNCSMVAPAGSS